MNKETQILLERLIEAVNAPEWWSVIATIIAAVAAAVITYKLGKRQNKMQEQQIKLQEQQNSIQEYQNKLQEQQNKIQEYQTKLQEQQIRQQEYSIYRQLYKLVKKADNEIDTYLNEITDSFGLIPWKRADDGFLKKKITYIEQIRNELEDNAIDFEIKFTKEFFDLKGYRDILFVMIHNLQLIDKLVDEEKVFFTNSSVQKIYAVEGCMEKGKAYYVAQHIKNKTYEVAIGSNLLGFVEQRKKLREGGRNILDKIRERCKVE